MASKKEKLVKKTFQVISILILFALMGCSTWSGTKTGNRARTGRTTRQETVSGAPAEKEVKRPEQKQFAAVSNPARKASMNMVQKGKAFINDEKYNKAVGAFREAIIIDSTNGIAYYFMSKARFYLEQYEQALGILDKAESLLASSEQWTEAITILRTEIERAYIKDGHANRGELIPIIKERDIY